MFDRRVLLVCAVAAVLLVALVDDARADPGHPQRPERFSNEEQLRKYLRELKQYINDNVRVGRFGKRNFVAPAAVLTAYPKQQEPEWKNEDDYYAQFNI